jgi:hypothetical protein
MFYGCSSLTVAPSILPATTLAPYCYCNMFYGCSSLTVAPELPATTLANYCYYYMFNGCRSLNHVKVGFTDWVMDNNEFNDWLYNVSPTGTFVCPEKLPKKYGGYYIPSGWTVELIRL